MNNLLVWPYKHGISSGITLWNMHVYWLLDVIIVYALSTMVTYDNNSNCEDCHTQNTTHFLNNRHWFEFYLGCYFLLLDSVPSFSWGKELLLLLALLPAQKPQQQKSAGWILASKLKKRLQSHCCMAMGPITHSVYSNSKPLTNLVIGLLSNTVTGTISVTVFIIVIVVVKIMVSVAEYSDQKGNIWLHCVYKNETYVNLFDLALHWHFCCCWW